jgi:hypothetical protein
MRWLPLGSVIVASRFSEMGNAWSSTWTFTSTAATMLKSEPRNICSTIGLPADSCRITCVFSCFTGSIGVVLSVKRHVEDSMLVGSWAGRAITERREAYRSSRGKENVASLAPVSLSMV